MLDASAHAATATKHSASGAPSGVASKPLPTPMQFGLAPRTERDRPEIFAFNFYLHMSLFGLCGLFHVATCIFMRCYWSAAIFACVHASICFFRRSLHKRDNKVAQQLAWRVWFCFFVTLPILHMTTSLFQQRESAIADNLAVINSSSLLAPALLVVGLITGSFGFSYRRKLRQTGIILLEMVIYWLNILSYVPEHTFDVACTATATVSCFLAGALIVHLFEVLMLERIHTEVIQQERIDQLGVEKDRLVYDRSLAIHRLEHATVRFRRNGEGGAAFPRGTGLSGTGGEETADERQRDAAAAKAADVVAAVSAGGARAALDEVTPPDSSSECSSSECSSLFRVLRQVSGCRSPPPSPWDPPDPT